MSGSENCPSQRGVDDIRGQPQERELFDAIHRGNPQRRAGTSRLEQTVKISFNSYLRQFTFRNIVHGTAKYSVKTKFIDKVCLDPIQT